MRRRRPKTRILPLALFALITLFALSAPALASCAPPATVAENARRADAVVYGRVTAIVGGAMQFTVVRALKGTVAATIVIHPGPGRGAGATSIDYDGRVGTDHVLYAVAVADGYETNACIGSHPGAPTADELALFGTGSPTAGTPGMPAPTNAPAAADPIVDPALGVGAITTAAALAVAAVTWAVARKRSRA